VNLKSIFLCARLSFLKIRRSRMNFIAAKIRKSKPGSEKSEGAQRPSFASLCNPASGLYLFYFNM